MAPGQTYPVLGFSETGAPLYTYDDRERALAGPPTAVATAADPTASPPSTAWQAPAQPPNSNRLVAIGVAVAMMLVVIVGFAFTRVSGGENPAPRADPPASQSLDDPYLQGLPNQSETSVPRDPERTDPGGRTGTATVVYDVEVDNGTVLYVEGDRARIDRVQGKWTTTIRNSQVSLLRVSVLPVGDSAASCSITVDGKVVAEESADATVPTGILTCRFQG